MSKIIKFIFQSDERGFWQESGGVMKLKEKDLGREKMLQEKIHLELRWCGVFLSNKFCELIDDFVKKEYFLEFLLRVLEINFSKNFSNGCLWTILVWLYSWNFLDFNSRTREKALEYKNFRRGKIANTKRNSIFNMRGQKTFIETLFKK